MSDPVRPYADALVALIPPERRTAAFAAAKAVPVTIEREGWWPFRVYVASARTPNWPWPIERVARTEDEARRRLLGELMIRALEGRL